MENKLNIEFSDLSYELNERIFSFLPNYDLRNIWQIVCTGEKQSEGERTYENAEIRTVLSEQLAKRTLALLPFDLKTYPNPKKLNYGTRLVETARAVHKYLRSGYNTETRNQKAKENKEITAYLTADVRKELSDHEANSQALIQAAWEGRLDDVRQELQRDGVWINAANSEGSTAVHRASDRGYIEIVRCLINRGAELNQADAKGHTPLYYVRLHRDRAKLTQLLMENRAVDTTWDNDGENYTPLHTAAMFGPLCKVKLFTSDGADVNIKTTLTGYTPLDLAADGSHRKIVKHLIDCGADIKAAHNDGNTALWKAMKSEREWPLGREPGLIVKLLIEKGADIHGCDDEGRTLVWEAALLGGPDIVASLIEKGADIHGTNDEGRGTHDEGRTLLWWAADHGHTEIVELLIKKGADVNTVDSHGKTALMAAASRLNEDIVKLLINSGANIDAADNDGKTALFWMGMHYEEFGKYRKFEYILPLLIEKGTNVNAADNDGKTVLMEAAQRFHPTFVKLLIDNGANTDTTDNNGHTALWWAKHGETDPYYVRWHDQDDIVKLLPQKSRLPYYLLAGALLLVGIHQLWRHRFKIQSIVSI